MAAGVEGFTALGVKRVYGSIKRKIPGHIEGSRLLGRRYPKTTSVSGRFELKTRPIRSWLGAIWVDLGW